MWLPHFLAADLELHKFVDQGMTEAFRGLEVDEENPARMLERMDQKLIDLILEKHPLPGLRRFLDGYAWIHPEGQR
jgi:hypothetical protein